MKEVELFYYSRSGTTFVTPALPVPDGDGGLKPAKDAPAIPVCDKGRAVFGVPGPIKNGRVVRVALTVNAVEVGGYEIVTEFKPFAPQTAARRRK